MKIILIFISITLFQSCRHSISNGDSATLILGGNESSKYPGIVQISGKDYCTGVFIGKRTLITAAHCINIIDSTGGVGYEDSQGKIHTSIKSFHHVAFWGVSVTEIVEMDQRDVAILLFSENIAPEVLDLGFNIPTDNKSATIIGYGLTDTKWFGTKNLAKVKISKKVGDQAFVLDGTPSIAMGDSGSPLIVDEKIIGITSASNKLTTSKRRGIFANLSHPETIELMLRAKSEGADIASKIPVELITTSKKSVSGLSFKGSFFCDIPISLSDCSISNQFGNDGSLTIKMSNTPKEWSGVYQQEGEIIRAGDAKTFNPKNSKTYFQFKLYSDGTALYDGSGRGSFLERNAPGGNHVDPGEANLENIGK